MASEAGDWVPPACHADDCCKLLNKRAVIIILLVWLFIWLGNYWVSLVGGIMLESVGSTEVSGIGTIFRGPQVTGRGEVYA